VAAPVAPIFGDSSYNLLFKAALNTYDPATAGMETPIFGDSPYHLRRKIANNTVLLGGDGQSTDGAGGSFDVTAYGKKGDDIASAATTDLGLATGDFVDITGAATITSFGGASLPAGTVRVVRFTGVCTVTYNATSLILPGQGNITTAAGNTMILRSLGGGNWICIACSHVIGNGPYALYVDTTGSTFQIRYLGGTRTTFGASFLTIGGAGNSAIGRLSGASDGVVMLSNAGGTDFTRLQFGGVASNFPALGRYGNGLYAQQADGAGPTFCKQGAYVVPRATGTSAQAADSSAIWTNEGASAKITINLPGAAAGLRYSFIVQNANGIQVVAAGGDTIRIAGSVSAVAGNIECLVAGSAVTLVAINAVEWIALSSLGTWTVT
jgi:hypothetical protein